MGKSVREYPITYKYGYSVAYGGYHSGVDRGAPYGTPLIVNNTLIGYSGNTGYVLPKPTASNPKAGSHHHLGKHGLSGKLVDPGKTGFRMFSVTGLRPKVYEVGSDSRNGKYIRIRATSGRTYIHCHLSKINCVVGTKIK